MKLSTARRRMWVSLLVLGLAIVTGIVLSRRRQTANPEAGAATAEPPSRAPQVPRLADSPAAAADSRDYLQIYQGRSGRLSEGQPVSRALAAPELSVRRPAGALTVTADRAYATAGEELTIKAQLALAEPPEQPVDLVVRFSPMRDLTRQTALPMRAAPGDRADHFQLAINTDAPALRDLLPGDRSSGPPLELQYEVAVVGREDGQELLRSRSALLVIARPGASLLPETARLARAGEDIVVDFAIDVRRPGRFWAYAELWGSDGAGGDATRPIAFARQLLGETPAGRRRVALTFGGRVVRDMGVDGPYLVRNLTLSRVDTIPPHLAARIERSAVSPAWKSGEFGRDRQ